MDHHLPVQRTDEPARACIWVDAGLLTFRLCDRAFACDTCPLDAAIRGRERPIHGTREPHAACESSAVWEFPSDRLYSGRHVWVQPTRSGKVRIGLDACAARLLPPIVGLRGASRGERLHVGGTICVICVDRGEVEVGSPIAGRVVRWNTELDADPAAIAVRPYSTGWLGEIALASHEHLEGLIHADAARELARLDARHLGRQAAFGLLAPDAPERGWMDREMLQATRHALGDDAYLSILRGVLH